MNPDSDNHFKETPPAPDPKVMEAAWTAAVCEFHRSQHNQPKTNLIQWIWPVAAAATIAILCALLISKPHQPTTHSTTQNTPTTETPPDLAKLYNQGQQLFGNQLQAVTVTKNSVVWHLNEKTQPAPVTDQFVTLTLHQKNTPDLHIATRSGTPVDVNYQGETHQIEFLSDASDKIIAVGDEIYWDSEMLESPIQDSRLRNTSK